MSLEELDIPSHERYLYILFSDIILKLRLQYIMNYLKLYFNLG